jgi:PAS domain S-box-containing protein
LKEVVPMRPRTTSSRKASRKPKKKAIRSSDLHDRLLQELQNHQVELEMQNETLRASQAELEESRRKYRQLYDTAPVGYFTFDRSGLIREVNRTGAAMLGHPSDSLIGKAFYLYVAPEERPVFQLHLRALFKTEGRQRCEVHLKTEGKDLLPVRLESLWIEGNLCRTAVIDITQQELAEKSLRESKEAFEALFYKSPLAAWVLDPDRKLLLWNRAAERLFGWTEKELLGRSLPVVPPDRRGEFEMLWNQTVRRGAVANFETLRQRKDGSLVDVSISSAAVRDPDGRLTSVMAKIQEITERKQIEARNREITEALEEKTGQLEMINRAQKRFFSQISHELKQPLNSIIGFTQLLRGGSYGPLTEKQIIPLTRVYVNAGELVQMINNILDLAKIESGKDTLKIVRADLAELLEKILAGFEPLLTHKALSLEKRIASDFPRGFRTDPTKVGSILKNLLSNAIKYTEKGKIRVLLESCPDPQGVRLIVSDTGVGIRPEDQKRLFREFERSDRKEETEEYVRGTGLGLAIVRRNVAALKGTIGLKSALGKGTTFIITLPEIPE